MALKKPVTIFDYYNVGTYIDAMDSVNNWCVG